MRILIVGNGGREHALLWKLRRDAPEASFVVTRPNGGMSDVEALDCSPEDGDAITRWVQTHPVDLVVVGPEAPLADGLVDRLTSLGIPAFGPTAGAARIEASKSFAKALMVRHRVPTARYATFTSVEAAEAFVHERGAPVVVKASGLAAGKGAVVCPTLPEALEAVRGILGDRSLGDAGSELVIEEFMEGEELSVFALCDGSDAIALIPAQDHKRVGERDTGPNTGGMGAYAPVSIASPGLMREVRERILLPTLAALRTEGSPFRGLLYAGLMLTDEGPRVVEFNCRFGDPETQVVLPLMAGSLLEPMLAIARGESLGGWRPTWTGEAAVTTVLASGGYPGSYPRGLPIDLPAELDDDPRLMVFHAGTRRENGELVTSGGRVLSVTGVGPTLAEAALRSRAGAEAIRFQGRHYRRDIAWRELARDEAFRP
jgi:phosphoribosylamine---glycine ligase